MPSRSSRSPLHAIRVTLAAGEPLSSGQLARRAGVSQATAWRVLREDLRGETLLLGKGRGARFALVNTLGRHGHCWPVFQVRGDGSADRFARLTALAGDNWHIEFERDEPLYQRGLRDGFCEGWPWFLDSLRPEGHLGRIFARRNAPAIGANPDLDLWRPADYLLAALLFGGDFPGNFLIGEHHTADAEARPSEEDWPEIARLSAEGSAAAAAGASGTAGGERAKFVTSSEIVKFTRGRSGGSGRWADLLVAEALAAETLAAFGFNAAASRIVERGGFVFHASARFDRTGRRGRRGVHSLRAVDDGLFGTAEGSWPAVAERMRVEGLLSDPHAKRVASVWHFGQLIGNNDMHGGNFAFHPGPEGMLVPAPVYDMLPMRYRPVGGILPDNPLPDPPAEAAADALAREAAADYWRRVAEDDRVSADFRAVADRNRRR